jgi:hypothetical protein
MKRLIMVMVAMVVAVGWAGVATAAAQTQTDTDFSGGAHTDTEVVPPDDLALAQVFDISEDFPGTSLPAGWEMAEWNPGGSATVGGGVLTVDGARANPTGLYDPGRSLDFAATFTADPFQHVGFGSTFADAPWAMFSTGSGGALFARTFPPGGTQVDTLITGVDPLVRHDYSIEWTPTEVRYFIDGVLEVTHPIAITAQMRPIASDFNVDGGSVQVEYLDLYPFPITYPTSGTFTSRVFDAGDHRATWRTLSAALDAPAGTDVTFEVRTGTTPTPDASWTAFQPVGPGGAISGPLGRRYLQYRATLTTTDTSVTPLVESVTLGYEVDTAAPVTTITNLTVSGPTALVIFSSEAGARFECSLDAGRFQPCTSPWEYTGLSPGSHRVRVRAIDQLGNVGPDAERSFTIASPPTPPDTKAPKVRPRPRSVEVSDNGRFRVRLRCPADEIECRIVLRVRYKGKTVARKRVTVDGGDTERVTLRLNRSARAALVFRGRLRVRAVTTARDAAGNRGKTRTRMRLRADN